METVIPTTRRPTQLWGTASAQSLLTEWPTAPTLEEVASWIQNLRAGSLRLPQGLLAVLAVLGLAPHLLCTCLHVALSLVHVSVQTSPFSLDTSPVD